MHLPKSIKSRMCLKNSWIHNYTEKEREKALVFRTILTNKCRKHSGRRKSPQLIMEFFRWRSLFYNKTIAQKGFWKIEYLMVLK